MAGKVIKIGGASGYWGEASMSTPQLLEAGGLDYIVYDYLAEITMSIMARARAKNPDAGYATDFVTAMLKPNLKEIARQGVKILSNAGGVNPRSCAAAIRQLIDEQGLDLKVATVLGDDLIEMKDELASASYSEMFSDDSFPESSKVMSVNAYLGGFPVAKALDMGADIVVTGRSVDSAVTLGACIHAFGWKPQDLDKLASGSLAGHILECGPQATGGNFTDWETIADTIDHIGYPIAEISEDGSFVCTKPEDTGGTVNVGTITEQMLYEIGDPQAYMLPDVVCDFSDVVITQKDINRVHVTPAKGRPAPNTYKVSTTFADGFRGGGVYTFYGAKADEKAQKYADAALTRARRVFRSHNMADFTETSIEVIGAESQYGASSRVESPREVAIKVAVKHPDMAGVATYLKEATGLGLATPPGLSGFAGGRSKPSPVVRLFSFAIEKEKLNISIEIDGKETPFEEAPGQAFDPSSIERPAEPAGPDVKGDMVNVPLVALAWGRSGDKGNKANVGIAARKAEFYPYICAALTEEAVAKYYAHFSKGKCERFFLPGSHSINFLMEDALGGGGMASLRNDPQGKGYAQLLLDYPIPVPRAIAQQEGMEILEAA